MMYSIKITGSGTLQQIMAGLKDVAAADQKEIEQTLTGAVGRLEWEWETPTLFIEIVKIDED